MQNRMLMEIRVRCMEPVGVEGKDSSGNACRVFIENEGSRDTGFRPTIVTDSPALAEFEEIPMTAEIEDIEGGVMVRIYRSGGVGYEL